MTRNAHYKPNEIDIAQLHHGWPQLPDTLERKATAHQTVTAPVQASTFKCAVCARVAHALIATGSWFEVRAKIPA